ncbi:MAG: peptide chain release factor 3, partial [Oscillospiraceae bacterium]|nr:peptide chain release factor 3 [Oscillospiraceae bacterium]
GFEEVIVGVVGVLQFEVLEYRLKNEYNVDIIREGLPYQFIRWITSEKHIEGGMDELEKLVLTSDTKLIQDVKGNYLLIFTSEWNIKWALDKNEGLELAEFNRD